MFLQRQKYHEFCKVVLKKNMVLFESSTLNRNAIIGLYSGPGVTNISISAIIQKMDNKSRETETTQNKAMNKKKAAVKKKGIAPKPLFLLRLLDSASSNRAVIVCLKAEIQWGCGKSKHGNTMGQAVSLKEFVSSISN